MQTTLKIDELIAKRKKLSAQWITKLLRRFSVYFVFKKLKKLKILQLITKQKKLFVQWISKLVKDHFVSKNVKKI